MISVSNTNHGNGNSYEGAGNIRNDNDVDERDIDQHALTFILVWISNYIHHKLWDEITDPFPNFNGATVEFREMGE